MVLAPIILFVYKRLRHTQQTVESLKKNLLARESDLFIFSDGPKNEADVKLVNEVRKFIKNVNGFNKINIVEKEDNNGLANSIISGVTSILEKFDKAIILEDDLIFSPHFLKFMNEALNYYEEDNHIFSISGYSFPIDIPHNYNKDIYMLPRSSSWGWGTWLNRWQKADWNVKDYNEFLTNKSNQNIFNLGGEDLTPMLKMQMAGQIDSWGIRWAYAHFKNNSYCLYPVKSLCKNIGTDNSGTHSRATKKFDVVLSEKEKFDLIHDLNLNNQILENTRTLVQPSTIRKIINKLK